MRNTPNIWTIHQPVQSAECSVTRWQIKLTRRQRGRPERRGGSTLRSPLTAAEHLHLADTVAALDESLRVSSSLWFGKRRCFVVECLFAVEILRCCGSEVILEPIQHRLFLTQNAFTGYARLFVSESCGCANQNIIA